MKKILFFCLLSTVSISACSRVKDELGLTRRQPDEFAVVKHAPLEIPPDLNTASSLPSSLPSPKLGTPRPQEVSPEQMAQSTLLNGGKTTNSTDTSNGENAILQKAGAQKVDTNIRSVVDKEAYENADKNRPVVKKLLNMGNKKDQGAAVVVDAPAEAKRIKSKQTGETPSIEQ